MELDIRKNPNAISLLEKNLDKVDWVRLSANPNAIHILEKNLDKVDWTALSKIKCYTDFRTKFR